MMSSEKSLLKVSKSMQQIRLILSYGTLLDILKGDKGLKILKYP